MAPLKQWGFIQVERVMGWLTDRLLFQNQADIEECRRRRIAAAHKVVWIGNGVQLGTFRPEQEPDTDPPIVLCVGRFEPVKNHRMILETARILRERGVWFSLQLVGDGVLQSTYEAWVRERSLESHVQFLGYRDDVPALIAQASVCVLVSNKEGLPRALLEAAAGGRPAVATDVMGSRDTLVDKTTGFLVPLNDCVALADRLQQLLDDEELRRSLGRQARSYAGEHFDERIVTDRIIGVYDELLGQAGSTGRA
jgi:glycosyltransferase involved in cell wall biosynthesis